MQGLTRRQKALLKQAQLMQLQLAVARVLVPWTTAERTSLCRQRRLAKRVASSQPVQRTVLMSRPRVAQLRELALQAARLLSQMVAPRLSSRPIALLAFAARVQVRARISDGESRTAAGHQAAVVKAWHSARALIALGTVAPQRKWRTRGLHKAAERSSSALHAPHVCPQQYSFGHSCPPLLCGTARVPFNYNSVTRARSLLALFSRVNRCPRG
jgi:hypothetical protein